MVAASLEAAVRRSKNCKVLARYCESGARLCSEASASESISERTTRKAIDGSHNADAGNII